MVKQQPIPRGILVTALLGIVVWELTVARAFMIPVCLAALSAFLMNPLARFLRRHKTPEWCAVTLSAAVLALPFLVLLSFIALEIQQLVLGLPTITKGLNGVLEKLSEMPSVQSLHLPLTLSELSDRLASRATEGISALLIGLRAFLETGTQVVLVLIFSVVMLASREHLRRSAEGILAQFENLESARMLDEVTAMIEKFLMGRLIIAVIIGIGSIVTLRLFGSGYSFLLGFFIGIMTVIPEIGFLISLVPVIAVSIASGHSILYMTSLSVVLFIIHTVEGYLLTPLLVGTKLNINALAIFIGLFAGGLMWGVWGMFLSVPILGILRIAFSAAPTLRPWGELLAEKEDRALPIRLMRRRHRIEV